MNQIAPLSENADILALKNQQWFPELARRVMEIWRHGEGDLVLEIRNSQRDSSGRPRKTVKMDSRTAYRYIEQ